jgi:hypothetical protein
MMNHPFRSKGALLAGIEPAIDWTSQPLFPIVLAAAHGTGRFNKYRNRPLALVGQVVELSLERQFLAD